MDKLIPDPPPSPTTPLEDAMRADDLVKNREAIKRALDFYLCPEPAKPHPPSALLASISLSSMRKPRIFT